MIEPMTADEAREYIPQWGSYMTSSDPGYICYTAIPPEEAAHRDTMVAWLRDRCLPVAEGRELVGLDEDEAGDDVEQLGRAVAYLEGLTYCDHAYTEDEEGILVCDKCGVEGPLP